MNVSNIGLDRYSQLKTENSKLRTSITKLSAIVLAGGKSSRMGQDKALIDISGVPLLRRVCDAALQCTSHVFVVTSWGDRYSPHLPPTIALIAEVNPQGPLVGFVQALTQMQIHVQTDWVLLLACDLPQLQAESLQTWAEMLPNISPDTIALLPKGAKGWEPLCGFYRYECLLDLQNFVEQGGRSFQKWLTTQSVQSLEVDDRQMLFNCNTPEDLENF